MVLFWQRATHQILRENHFRCIQQRIFIRIDYSTIKWKGKRGHRTASKSVQMHISFLSSTVFPYFNPFHSHAQRTTHKGQREREGNEFFDTKNKSFFPLSGHCTVQRHCLCCGCWLHCGHYSIHINTFSMDFDASESEYRTICVVSSATKQKPKHLFSVHSRLFQYFFFLFFVRWSGRILSVSIREIFHRPTFLLSFFSHDCRLCAVWSVDVDCERALCVCVLIFFNLWCFLSHKNVIAHQRRATAMTYRIVRVRQFDREQNDIYGKIQNSGGHTHTHTHMRRLMVLCIADA